MTGAAFSLASGAVALLIHMALVPILLRLASRTAPVKVHVASTAAVHLAQVALLWRISAGDVLYWHGAAVLGAGAVGYLFVFSAVYKSVSLRMLLWVLKSRQPCVSIDRLTQEVVGPEVESRIALLLAMGHCVNTGGGFALSDRGIAAAARIRFVQRLLGIGKAGLY